MSNRWKPRVAQNPRAMTGRLEPGTLVDNRAQTRAAWQHQGKTSAKELQTWPKMKAETKDGKVGRRSRRFYRDTGGSLGQGKE